MKKIVSVLLAVCLTAALIPPLGASAATANGQAIVDCAMTYVGKVPYVWGGNNIDGANPGADCSGFVCRIFEKFGFNLWPNRTHLRDCGTNLGTNLDVAQPGDIIWYTGHVAIYAGRDSAGEHMVVQETGGNHQNVIYSRHRYVRAETRGVIRIPGVTNDNGGQGSDEIVKIVEITLDPNGGKILSGGNSRIFQSGKVFGWADPDMTREGYTFDGWYTQPVGGTKFYAGMEITQDTTFYAHWVETPPSEELKWIEITLEVNGGTYVSGSMQMLTPSGEILNLPDPVVTREGYTLDGWYTQPTGGTKFYSGMVITQDTTLYAHWVETQPGACTVTFNYGDTIPPVSVEVPYNGKTPIWPVLDNKDGRTFLGWFTQPEGGTQFFENTPVTSSITLYARWSQAISVTLTDKSGLNGGVQEVSPQGGKLTATFSAPENCLFGGYEVVFYNAAGTRLGSHKEAGGVYTTGQDAPLGVIFPFQNDEIRDGVDLILDGMTLTVGKDYYYEIIAVVDGQTYTSERACFRLISGNIPVTLTFDNPIGSDGVVQLDGSEPKLGMKIQGPASALFSKYSVSIYSTKTNECVVSSEETVNHALTAAGATFGFVLNEKAWEPGEVYRYQFTAYVDGVAYPSEMGRFRYGKSASPVSGFSDVNPQDYYADAVDWAVKNNITSGTGNNCFSPHDTCTRGQIVTFLWKAAGKPQPKSRSVSFTDVNPGDYFYEAVQWAVEKNITSGTDATHFSPDAPCNRGQAVTFLWRAAGRPSGTGKSFADVQNGQFYTDAVKWAVSKNITSGTSSTTFSPDQSCTRGQIVTFLYRDRR